METTLSFTDALHVHGHRRTLCKLWFPVVFLSANREKNGPSGPAAPNVCEVQPDRPLKRMIGAAEIPRRTAGFILLVVEGKGG